MLKNCSFNSLKELLSHPNKNPNKTTYDPRVSFRSSRHPVPLPVPLPGQGLPRVEAHQKSVSVGNSKGLDCIFAVMPATSSTRSRQLALGV